MRTYDEIYSDVTEKKKRYKENRRRGGRMIGICAVFLAVVIALPTGIFWIAHNRDGDTPKKLPATVDSYDELYEALQSILSYENADHDDDKIAEIEPAPSEGENIDSGSSGNWGSDESDDIDYSDTNLQVVGVQEADILKTDGRYIYAKGYDCVRIIEANGKNVSLIGEIPLSQERKDDGITFSLYRDELYVCGDRLVLLKVIASRKYNGPSSAVVEIYDISDRSEPRLIESYSQDGDYVSSRMIGAKLYVVSRRYISRGEEIDKKNPESFVPGYELGGTRKLISADSIYINQSAEASVYSTGYVVAACVDVEASPSLDSIIAALGGGDCIYSSRENMYLLSPYYSTSTENGISESGNNTAIMKFSLGGGKLELAAVGSVRGYILNQFSVDEKDGYLRIVTTASIYRWQSNNGLVEVNTDSDINDAPIQALDTKVNDLYVLDGELNIVGSITGLADDERVYSVRFDGDAAYFVTYRETDPLFSVDLSDPTAPTVLGELKLPGFSNYLHPFSDGLLFGIGVNGDENGNTDWMKLSMFDVSDPSNVTECSRLVLDGVYYWSALYDHKAIMVDASKNLIGFFDLSRGAYVIYSYIGGEFVERGVIDGIDDSSARGLYIGSYFYICGKKGLVVCDMADFDVVNTLEFSYSSSDMSGVETIVPSGGETVAPPTVSADGSFCGELVECDGEIYDVDTVNYIVYIEFSYLEHVYRCGFKFDAQWDEIDFVDTAIDGELGYEYVTAGTLDQLAAKMKCTVWAGYVEINTADECAIHKYLVIRIDSDQLK